MNNISLIISREYNQRVRKKAFIISTILMPFVFLGLMFGPTLVQSLGKEPTPTITVVDSSGVISQYLSKYGSLPYKISEKTLDEEKTDANNQYILYIGESVLENPSDMRLYVNGNSTIELEMLINEDFKRVIENTRLERAQRTDVIGLLDEVKADVNVATVKIDDEGNEEQSASILSFLIGILMAFMLYMFILIYGQLVMMGIIEEKNNRVLELIVTSVKPSHLMLGKIIGVGLVAVTQVLIWGVIIGGFIQFILPLFTGPELMEQVTALRDGIPFKPTYDMQLLQMMAILTSLSYIFSIFGYLILFLIGGFMLYSSLYAAIGSSVDNPQDGSQLQMFVIVPVIFSLIFAMNVGSNPDSDLAVWLSMIPFTSPMIMMARIPAGVPFWQIGLSIVILYLTVMFFIWIAAKIYRVGIFMYGKKPTIKEIVKWTRYNG